MHDTLNLEERGIPSVFVATVQFTDAAIRQAESLGGQANGVYVEHPIQDRTDAEMTAIADDALEAVLAGLLT